MVINGLIFRDPECIKHSDQRYDYEGINAGVSRNSWNYVESRYESPRNFSFSSRLADRWTLQSDRHYVTRTAVLILSDDH